MSEVATNMLCRAFADIPDAKARITRAREQIATEYAPLSAVNKIQLEKDFNHVTAEINKINPKGK
ncbi:hypothetical protein [Psychrobacter fulvigenes]|uniref:hypothetical protein n=1 Tax=Psychrobacter fulvigenes TaxID=533323 RepID=UPI00191A28A5|nr:hypothetical protein [Psychrobacter fulvigenes]